MQIPLIYSIKILSKNIAKVEPSVFYIQLKFRYLIATWKYILLPMLKIFLIFKKERKHLFWVQLWIAENYHS